MEDVTITSPRAKGNPPAPARTTIRITPGGAPAARCTLSTERKGDSIVLKLSPAAVDKVKALRLSNVVPEWSLADGKITALNLYSAERTGERGYVVSTSRRLRLHVSFPARNITLVRKPVVLSEPVEDGGSLVFAIPDGMVVMPATD